MASVRWGCASSSIRWSRSAIFCAGTARLHLPASLSPAAVFLFATLMEVEYCAGEVKSALPEALRLPGYWIICTNSRRLAGASSWRHCLSCTGSSAIRPGAIVSAALA